MKYFYVWESNPRYFASKASAQPFWPTAFERNDYYLLLILFAFDRIACQHPPGPRCGEMNQTKTFFIHFTWNTMHYEIRQKNYIVYGLFGNGENGSELDNWANKVSSRGFNQLNGRWHRCRNLITTRPSG